MYPYEPIAAVNYPEFYLIPGFSRYVISKDGSVFNTETGKFLKGYVHQNYLKPEEAGYWVIGLISNSGKPVKFSRHRLLCLIFKYPGIIFSRLEVNHINGIKGDDRLDNLEWVTSGENTRHAFDNDLVSRKKISRPMTSRDVDTGIITKYPHINGCGRELGITTEMAKYRYHAGEEKIFPERKQYRASHSDEPWYIPKNVEIELLASNQSKRIIMRNIFTNEILEFERSKDLAKYLGRSSAMVSEWVNKPGQPVLPGFIQLKFAYDETPWREVEDAYSELDSSGLTRVIVVTDTITGIDKIYLSAVECANDKGLLTTTLNWRLKSDVNHIYPDGVKRSH